MAANSGARRPWSESKQPLLVKLSTTRRLTALRSTRSQQSNNDLKAPSWPRVFRTASTAPSPTFLMAARPKRMGARSVPGTTVKNMSDSLPSGGGPWMPRPRDARGAGGGEELDAHLPALADVDDHLVGVRALRREQGGHEVRGVVRLEV